MNAALLYTPSWSLSKSRYCARASGSAMTGSQSFYWSWYGDRLWYGTKAFFPSCWSWYGKPR